MDGKQEKFTKNVSHSTFHVAVSTSARFHRDELMAHRLKQVDDDARRRTRRRDVLILLSYIRSSRWTDSWSGLRAAVGYRCTRTVSRGNPERRLMSSGGRLMAETILRTDIYAPIP
ncbi:hypothetical protein EVAR_37729_1 [Eumeta japonica]|uniref:Uncharacterized protein n=1 Tax=Eumeta variegata TaxID=151549 RepID=A0A4C1YQH6_EUMVA|nr:hypothetical protein EVAR_37729_1 [Eumeta japonica]